MGAPICWAAAESDTQSTIFDSSALKKQLLIFRKKPEDTIQIPLDDKLAITEYKVGSYNSSSNTTRVDVIIRTGRKHQIRRHFEMIGFPVMGDSRYGKGNKNTEGMKLTATALEFECPISGIFRIFNLS